MPMDGLEYGAALAIRLSDWLTLFFANLQLGT